MIKLKFWRRRRKSIEELYYDEPFHNGKTLRDLIEKYSLTSYKVEDVYLWEFKQLEKKFMHELEKNARIQSNLSSTREIRKPAVKAS